ncbi:hypothetical protein BU17DRAFT_37747 [Hysterangium stoloniferum]|nr:hypothetical protein BU17DRAFT_37747 [Hysterangium stoloniferum]
MAFPQPIPTDEKLREFDSVPLFMRSLPEDATDDVAISALQSLAYEGTPNDIAENFKSQGNDYFKGKRYTEARGFYSQGLDAQPTERVLIEALLCNRAACNLELKNYGNALRDCSKAISLNPHSSKAHYRSALALIALERFEESLDCCTRCLAFDANNAGVRQLRDRAESGKLLQERKEKERTDRLDREAKAKRKLELEFKNRNIISIDDPSAESSPYSPHFVKDEENPREILVLPVFFLYPQHATSDLISHYHENVPPSHHLEEMFPASTSENIERRPEWDKNGQYIAPNLMVFAITHRRRLLKVGKKMTLLDVCNAAKSKDSGVDGLELKNGCLSFVILPKGEVERRWIEDFKAGNT